MNSYFRSSCLFMTFLFVGCASQAVNDAAEKSFTQDDALTKAISFAASSKLIKEVNQEIRGMLPRDANPYIEKNLGRDNLSFFLINVVPDRLTEFEFQFNQNRLFILMSRMADGKSLVFYEELSEIEWVKDGDAWKGSFAFDAGKVFRGTLASHTR